MSFLPIPVSGPVPDRGRMTTTSTSTALLSRIRDGIAHLVRAHEVLWDAMERIDPDPTPYLHWEPTASGWRLYGHRLPPP